KSPPDTSAQKEAARSRPASRGRRPGHNARAGPGRRPDRATAQATTRAAAAAPEPVAARAGQDSLRPGRDLGTRLWINVSVSIWIIPPNQLVDESPAAK